MEIKRRHAVVVLVSFVLVLPALCLFETMAFSASLKLTVYALLASTYANIWTNAQVALPCSNSTAIKGTPFPSLIDATTEDLIGGLESGLFTSVDLVNAYVARIMEVGPNSIPQPNDHAPHPGTTVSIFRDRLIDIPSGELHAAYGHRT